MIKKNELVKDILFMITCSSIALTIVIFSIAIPLFIAINTIVFK